MATKNKPNEIYLTRVYEAPVKTVWDAWIDPKQVAQWWGPRGFTLTTQNKDVRPGGTWTYMMHGPNGVDYPNKTLFHEVEEFSRLVYDHGGNDDRPPMFRVTVHFSEVGGKTKMEMTMAFPTAEAAAQSKKFIKEVGGDATWDRLAEFLAMKTSGTNARDIFVINRSFDAPLNSMFEMFTDPKLFSQWLPPIGFNMEYLRPEIRPGGTSFYCMTGEGKMKIYGKMKYHEISKPNRIVYSIYFCDENENVIRHPMEPTWPESLLTTITLEPEGADKTRVTLVWEVEGKATDVERRTFHEAKADITEGWTGSFDKLEKLLK